TGDVGEDLVLAFATGDQTHRHAGDRRLDRHTRVHQSQGAAADACLRGAAVTSQDFGNEADDVGELVSTGDYGLESSLAQGAVPDFAASGATEAAHFSDREGREVVVVHETLRLFRRKRVELLLHAHGAEGRDCQYLGLATLE